jgi:hypothetical protein
MAADAAEQAVGAQKNVPVQGCSKRQNGQSGGAAEPRNKPHGGEDMVASSKAGRAAAA